MNPNASPTPGTWLGFELAGQCYAVPLADVREIIRPDQPTPVPGADADVMGIINLRGSIVTVLDGCRRLGLSGTAPGSDQRLVVFQCEAESVGVRIDALRDVIELDTSELMPPPPGRPARPDDPVLGVLYRDDGFITLLDAGKLCRSHVATTEASA